MVRPAAIRRFYGLMAMAGFTEKELVDVLRHVLQSPPSVILNEVRALQNNIGEHPADVAHEHGAASVNPRVQPEHRPAGGLERDTIDQIERLLFSDKRTTKAVAVRRLRNILHLRYPAAGLPEFDPKEGFGKWLSALAEVVPLGEIMHAAARLGSVSKGGDDWIKSDA